MAQDAENRSAGLRIAAILFDGIKPGPPRQREIWLRIVGPWYWRRLKISHWKGWPLALSPFAIIALLGFVDTWHLPMPALYWLGAIIFVVVYWILLLDHTKWK